MINPISKEIKVDHLNFSDEATRRLASLAMTVEIREHKRFSVSKTADLIVELINVASKSAYSEVRETLSNLVSSLNDQQKSLLIGFGAEMATPTVATPEIKSKTTEPDNKKYLFGARG